jgi:hypothetical protein
MNWWQKVFGSSSRPKKPQAEPQADLQRQLDQIRQQQADLWNAMTPESRREMNDAGLAPPQSIRNRAKSGPPG